MTDEQKPAGDKEIITKDDIKSVTAEELFGSPKEEKKDKDNPFTGVADSKDDGDTFVWGTRKAKSHLQVMTVAEAKEQLASMNLKDGDSLVWGTRVWRGSKKDFEIQLSNMSDGDAIVWGN